jgi:hypothetical protein
VFERTRKRTDGDYRFRIILEMIRSSKKADKTFLRATIEGLDRMHHDLATFPHMIVENPDGRSFIAGSTRISQMLFEKLRWEARQGKQTCSETNRIDSFIFGRLHEAGLTDLQGIDIGWTEDYNEQFLEMEHEHLRGIFKKILLLLEDHQTRRLLMTGTIVRADFGEIHSHLDFSQLGRALNISFGRTRSMASIGHYLHRLPGITKAVSMEEENAPLAGVRVLLVHHVTAEVLGLIAALKALGVREVLTLFIHYGEEIPSDFLEALLHMDQENFRCYCLNNVREPGSVEGYFVLSPRFSRLDGLEQFGSMLFQAKAGYFDAMQRTAGRLFLELLARTIRDDAKCLIIEDGGYLTPLLERWVKEDAGIETLLARNHLGLPDGGKEIARLPLREVLDRYLTGTVEHTKNGYDRLAEIISREGCLSRPAFSIAVSRIKVNDEAQEVAASILSALEWLFHAQGKSLSRRKSAVIGAEGAIGRHIMAQLAGRHGTRETQPLLAVDIRTHAEQNGEPSRAFATRFRDLPREWAMNVDLVIGVTGHPAFLWDDMESLLLEGTASLYYLASGSTKTIEFESVSQGVERLLKMQHPAIAGYPCRIEGCEITDPQTRRNLGYKYVITFRDHPHLSGEDARKEIHFLGNLMPVNFLFYGVPGEVFDPVLTQLLKCSIGLVRRTTSGDPPARFLHAVDHEIDEDGKPLAVIPAAMKEPA